MKKYIKLFSILLIMFLLTGCSYDCIKEISLDELKTKLENKETFILEIKQDGCSHCEEFNPKFNDVLSENNLVAYAINLTRLKEKKQTDEFNTMYSFTGTPTVIFIKDGEELPIYKRIVGSLDRKDIKKKLISAEFIKEK